MSMPGAANMSGAANTRTPQPHPNADRVAGLIDGRIAQIAGNKPPEAERGVILPDMRLQPDTWTEDPFWPQEEAPTGMIGYDRVWHLYPNQWSEPALLGIHDTGTASTGTLLEHRHPTRALLPGDRVLIFWVRGVPVVMEILGIGVSG